MCFLVVGTELPMIENVHGGRNEKMEMFGQLPKRKN